MSLEDFREELKDIYNGLCLDLDTAPERMVREVGKLVKASVEKMLASLDEKRRQCRDERDDHLQALRREWGLELKDRWQNPVGAHEAMDRTYVALETWMEYVVKHPTVILDEGAYGAAWRAWEAMHCTYQSLGDCFILDE